MLYAAKQGCMGKGKQKAVFTLRRNQVRHTGGTFTMKISIEKAKKKEEQMPIWN